MFKVQYISESLFTRSFKSLTLGGSYYLDESSLYSSSDCKWYADIYTTNSKENWVGRLCLDHFRMV